jgi:hypothetical protein
MPSFRVFFVLVVAWGLWLLCIHILSVNLFSIELGPHEGSNPSPTPSLQVLADPTQLTDSVATEVPQIPTHWRSIKWETLPIIQTYLEVAPTRSTPDPCQLGVDKCERILKYVELSFPPFHLPFPEFATLEDRTMWTSGFRTLFPATLERTASCEQRGLQLCIDHPEYADPEYGAVSDEDVDTTGLLVTMRGSIIRPNDDQQCGNRERNFQQILNRGILSVSGGKEEKGAEKIFIRVPMSNLWQHFLDGSLPKLMQWLDDIHPETTIIIQSKHSPYLCAIPESQGLQSFCGTLESESDFAEVLHYACHTPPMHPYHWRRMQSFLGVRVIPLEQRNVVIYNTRNGNSNNGGARRVGNDEEVIDHIRKYVEAWGGDFVVFNSGQFSPEMSLRLFNSARAVIGPHGGAMYNTFFCLPGTLVVEFTDMLSPSMLRDHHLTPFRSSRMLEHTFYAIPQVISSYADEFMISLDSIDLILRKELPYTL